MPKIVRMPNGDLVRMPDDLDDNEIKALIAHKFPDFAAQMQAKADPSGPALDVPGDPMQQQPAAPTQRDKGLFGLPLMTEGVDAGYTPSAAPFTQESGSGQMLSGVNTGIGQVLGAPMDIGNLMVRGADAGLTAMGADVIPDRPVEAVGGAKFFTDPMKQAGAILPESKDPGLQGVRGIGEGLGSMILPDIGPMVKAVKAGKVLPTLAKEVQVALTGSMGGELAHEAAPDNPWAAVAGSLAGGMGLDTIEGLLAKRASQKAAPTAADLKGQYDKLYDDALASKLVVSQPAAKTFIDTVTAKALKEGLDETLTPATKRAVVRMQQMADRPMSIDDAHLIRKLLGVAASGNEAKYATDRRLAVGMIHDLDNFLIGLGKKGPAGERNLSVASGDAEQASKSLTEANALYTRAKRGEVIQEAIDLAKAGSTGKLKGAAYEKALRQKFRDLEKDIIEGRLKGMSPGQVAAIHKVAEGGAVGNIASLIGDITPYGSPLPWLAGAGAYQFGGGLPAVAAALAGGAAVRGVARGISTASTKNKAEIAKAMALRGGPAPKTPLFGDEQAAIMQALMGSQAAQFGGQ